MLPGRIEIDETWNFKIQKLCVCVCYVRFPIWGIVFDPPTLKPIQVTYGIVIDYIMIIKYHQYHTVYLLNSEKSNSPPTKTGSSKTLKNDFGAFLLSDELIIERKDCKLIGPDWGVAYYGWDYNSLKKYHLATECTYHQYLFRFI